MFFCYDRLFWVPPNVFVWCSFQDFGHLGETDKRLALVQNTDQAGQLYWTSHANDKSLQDSLPSFAVLILKTHDRPLQGFLESQKRIPSSSRFPVLLSCLSKRMMLSTFFEETKWNALHCIRYFHAIKLTLVPRW